jgi:hypothetical protein
MITLLPSQGDFCATAILGKNTNPNLIGFGIYLTINILGIDVIPLRLLLQGVFPFFRSGF